MLYGSPESLTGGQEIQGNVLSMAMFYQKNPVAGTYSCSLVSMLICLLGRVLHFTRKGATLNSLWGVPLLWENAI